MTACLTCITTGKKSKFVSVLAITAEVCDCPYRLKGRFISITLKTFGKELCGGGDSRLTVSYRITLVGAGPCQIG